jgi:hypothetical protein
MTPLPSAINCSTASKGEACGTEQCRAVRRVAWSRGRGLVEAVAEGRSARVASCVCECEREIELVLRQGGMRYVEGEEEV